MLRPWSNAYCLLAIVLAAGGTGWGQTPNTAGNIERTLRYRPEGTDFTIENGTARFNRPLYGGRSAFRVDAGDRPEFGFYLPGKGGLLRLGVVAGPTALWLADAQRVLARYRPGEMIYEIRDPALGEATLKVTVIATKDVDGLAITAEINRPGAFELTWAFGGVTGDPLNDRAGDLLGGRDPGEAWNFRTDDFSGATLAIAATAFEYKGRGGTVSGVAPAGSRLSAGDAAQWQSLAALLGSKGEGSPILVGRSAVSATKPVSLVFRAGARATLPPPESISIIVGLANRARESILEQVAVETPDPFVNVAAEALAIAADAIWQPPSAMQGAVAWRTASPGWRGPLAFDLLGWHDRARQHVEAWAAKQETDGKIAAGPASAEPTAGRERDLNLAFADVLLRHVQWTGDLEMGRKYFPVIQRHLAWEKRLFDRDGLYEGYGSNLAGEGLFYSGGGSAQATARNLSQNRAAARLARALNLDGTAAEAESRWIADAIQHDLWMPETGAWAEYREATGARRLHPAAALWSVYQPIDSGAGDAFQAYQALRYLDTQVPRLPVRGPGMPGGDLFVLPTSTWQPYEWSLNNVSPAESAAAALAYWQAGRAEEGWRLWKGALVDSLFAGTTPGNFAGLSGYDAQRGETYRDFGDTIGATARALVEGLFGLVPDVPGGELLVRPGFPREWIHAAFRSPDINFNYRLDSALAERLVIEPRFGKPLRLRLRLAARAERVAGVTVNGQNAAWRNADDAIGVPQIEILAPAAARFEVVVRWVGNPPIGARPPMAVAAERPFKVDFAPATALEIADPQRTLKDAVARERIATGTVSAPPGWHTVFTKVQQDSLVWWMPVNFEVRPVLAIVPSATQDGQRIRFKVHNNGPTPVERVTAVEVGGVKSTATIRIPANSDSPELSFATTGMLPGAVRVRLDLGEGGVISDTIYNWAIAPAAATTWKKIDLAKVFNDSLPKLFTNEYLSPRPAETSFQIPRNGLGTWATPGRTFAVSDAALRRGEIALPSGVVFSSPAAAEANNVAFTSQWANHPKEISLQVSGRASHAYLLVTGTTNPMQAQMDNGEILITYWDGSTEKVVLRNPTNWWPIERDLFTDEFAFQVPGARPLRVELATGRVYVPGAGVPAVPRGGAATVFDLPLDPTKQLFSLTVRPLSPDVIIGVLALTLAR